VTGFYPEQGSMFRGAQEVRYLRFAELRESLLFDLRDGGLREATVVAYWSDLDSVLWWCLEHGVDALDPGAENVGRYLDELRAGRYSLNTIARRITAMRHFYEHVVAAGELAASPIAGIHQRRPRPARAARAAGGPARLTAGQRRRLLAAAEDDRDRAVLRLLFDTVTVTQLGRAVVADVRLEPPAALSASHRGIAESVPLGADTAAAVARYLAGRARGPLIVDGAGRPIDRFDVHRLLARIGRRAGIRTPVTPARLPQPPPRNARASSQTSAAD
jgi:site-specific recombinase XerD